MTDIVAGRFDQQAEARAAVDRLLQHGFGRGEVSSFFVNPPGQHARYPVGGDRGASAGAKGAGRGAIIGAVIGAVLGLVFGIAAVRVYGYASAIAGAVAGAYLGMLAGALARLQDRPAWRRSSPEVRPSGIRWPHTRPRRRAATKRFERCALPARSMSKRRRANGKTGSGRISIRPCRLHPPTRRGTCHAETRRVDRISMQALSVFLETRENVYRSSRLL